MMDYSFIAEELGVKNSYPDVLMNASMKFMMAFYFSEVRFFQRNVTFRMSDDYAENILNSTGKACEKQIDEVFEYFKDRYLTADNASHRLHALTMTDGEHENSQYKVIGGYLTNADSPKTKLSACLKICMRIRHNLFHANKYESMIKDPKEQAELITKSYQLLSCLLKES